MQKNHSEGSVGYFTQAKEWIQNKPMQAALTAGAAGVLLGFLGVKKTALLASAIWQRRRLLRSATG